MLNFIKIVLSALIIFLASEIAKRNTLLGAIIISLPMASLLSIIWLYIETKDIDRIASFSQNIFLMIFPSLSFFIIFPWFLKKNLGFGLSIFLSLAIMVVLYFSLNLFYKKIGISI